MTTLQGLMQDQPLTLTMILRHAQRLAADQEVVSVTSDLGVFRYHYRDAFRRVHQLANALQALGLKPGERVATLAWNDHRHLELYFAVTCCGAVLHTINPRLFPEQITYMLDHAEDHWLFLDPTFVPLLEKLKPLPESLRGLIALCDEKHLPGPSLQSYETLLQGQPETYGWPDLDENTACVLCYTSGTTGQPKGVLYSHRALMLHTYASALPDVFGLSIRDTVMPVVPMFHVNGWGIVFSAPMVGAKLVLPGPKMGDGATLAQLINDEQITLSAGVPTVWLALLNHLEQHRVEVPSLQRVLVGGAACPLSIMQRFEPFNVEVQAAWGMTETSPLGCVNVIPDKASLSAEAYNRLRVKAGRPTCGIEFRIVDDSGNELPWDGQAFGRLQVRGPWVARAYFKRDEAGAFSADGWFDTGDVATITESGYMQVTDRTKDVIKSGGEWISSIELENLAIAHPQVAEAAVVGVPHPKWDERPLLLVVPRDNAAPDPAELIEWLEGKVAKWWLPDEAIVIDALPHTATGKLDKKVLREQYRDRYGKAG